MPDKEIFEFAIIRVMPKIERGECINVGVILFSKKKNYIGIKYTIDKERLTAFAKDLDIDEINEYLNAWEMIAHGHHDGGVIASLALPERFRWLTASKSTVLQCSKVHPGMSADPARVLEDLFGKYVL